MTEAEQLAKMQKSFDVIAHMGEWWVHRADRILERLSTENTEDVLLYHDAVSVFVSARSVFEIAKMHSKESQ